MVDKPPVSSSVTEVDDRVATLFNSLRRLVNAMYSASRATQQVHGVTAAQLFVLSHIRKSPNISIGTLAKLTMTHQSTVSVVVRRLVRRKLVRKRRSADDARRVELTLTAAGLEVVETAPEAFQLRLHRVLETLDQADQVALVAAFSRLVTAIGAQDTPSGMFFEAVDS